MKIILFLLISCSSISSFSQSEFDSITIGEQTWMVKNLNVTHFRNGDLIPEAKTMEEWVNAGKNKQPAWCYHEDDTSSGNQTGKLYNWYAVNDSRGLAPKGWRIPSNADWTKLIKFNGEDSTSLKKLKLPNSWSNDEERIEPDAGNESGFSAIPVGYIDEKGVFYPDHMGYPMAFWWSAAEQGQITARVQIVLNWWETLGFVKKAQGLSVRCVKDR